MELDRLACPRHLGTRPVPECQPADEDLRRKMNCTFPLAFVVKEMSALPNALSAVLNGNVPAHLLLEATFGSAELTFRKNMQVLDLFSALTHSQL